jgi:SAM-dependent methyltransferase
MSILKKVGAQFRKPTGFLGWLISCLMIKENRISYEYVIKELEIQPDNKILEIGYGPGIGIKLISARYKSCDIYGIDFSELMYIRASRRNKEFIYNGRVHLILGDFVNTEIVYFWNNLIIPFERIKSLLKDDGLFCLYMENKENLAKLKFTKDDIFNKYSIDNISKALKSAGFREIDYYYNKGYYIKAKK